jgi:exopolyphosphatase/guanosine-5'-triphosphate,3'-diphosphate pyrophosphatase
LEIGAVRLHRLFKVSDPPDKAAIFTMRRFTKAYLKKQAFKRSDSLVFSGGTATTLSALKLGLKSYSASAVEGCELSEEWLENILAEFLQLNLAQRKELLHIDPERAEVIIGGCVIMLELLARLRLNKCRVTNRGLRYGLLYEWGEKERIKDKG